MSTGDVIRKAREAAGLSQAELAQRLGYATQASVSNLERDRQKLDFHTAARLADALGVPRSAFLEQLAGAVAA